MQFRVDAKTFVQALQRMKAGLVSHRSSTFPYVVIAAQEDKIVLSTWTKATRMAIAVAGQVEKQGKYALPLQQLLQVMKPLHGMVLLSQKEDSIVISSEDQSLKYQLPVQGQEIVALPSPPLGASVGTTYTKTERVERLCQACQHTHWEYIQLTYRIQHVETQQVILPQACLARLIKQVAWLPPEWADNGPRCLTGICLEMEEGVFSLIGADHWCIAIASEPVAGNWGQRVLVPATLLKKALRFFPKGAEVRIEAVFTQHQLIRRNETRVSDAPSSLRSTHLRLLAEETEVTLALMDEHMLDYRQKLAASYPTQVVCATAHLLSVLETLSPLAQDHDDIVKCSINGSALTVQVIHEPLPALYTIPLEEKTGPDVSLILNASYLLTALKASTSPQVTIGLSEPGQPLTLQFNNEQYCLLVQTSRE